MRFVNGNYTIADEKNAVNLKAVHRLLSKSYWAKNRSPEAISATIEKSLCFSLFRDEKQIGFARVLTDYVTYAVILDMIIDEEHRGKGLGKWLMETITTHSSIGRIRQILWTSTAENFYEKFGFRPAKDKPVLMVKPSFNDCAL